MKGQFDQKDLNYLLRNDMQAFVEKCLSTLSPAVTIEPNWHHAAMAYALQQCLNGETRRLIINLPPRNLKSVFCSVGLPAFALGHDPSKKIVCVSYSADLAANFARETRAVMEQHWYCEAFPDTRLSTRRSAEADFQTTKRGSRLATSVGGTLTGRGGSLIIIDDPMKADDVESDVRRQSVIEWFKNTLITRLDDKRNDVIIIVMQRLHVDDLVGHVSQNGEWKVLNLAAIAQKDEKIPIGPARFHFRRKGELLHPAREGKEVLEALRRDLGQRSFDAQYLQAPVPPDGTIIHWSWFKVFDDLGDRLATDEIVQSWDTAVKTGVLNDYSVCTTWMIRGKHYYLLDLFRGRMEFPELKRKAIELQVKFNASKVLIEDASSGQSLLQELKSIGRSEFRAVLVPIAPEKDKRTRAEAQTVLIEGGFVHLPKLASWLGPLFNEIRDFPRAHDDQVDSMTQFLHWAKTRKIWARLIPIRYI